MMDVNVTEMDAPKQKEHLDIICYVGAGNGT